MDKGGKFIVIEGTDGSGKATQTELLAKYLSEKGYEVKCFDFPRYGQRSAAMVEDYVTSSHALKGCPSGNFLPSAKSRASLT